MNWSAALKTYENLEAFMRDVIRPFNARLRQGLSPTVKEIYADDDWVVVLFDGQAVARDGEP